MGDLKGVVVEPRAGATSATAPSGVPAGRNGYPWDSDHREAALAGGSFVLPRKDQDRPRLSPREVGILEYIASGTSNKQIAGALNISEQTVKNHVSTIMAKLGANNRTHALLIAMLHGVIPVERAFQLAAATDPLSGLPLCLTSPLVPVALAPSEGVNHS